MSVSKDGFGDPMVSCDIAGCGNHVHLNPDTTDTPKDDPRMSSLVNGWKLDVFGVGIDICPDCLAVTRP